MRIQALISNKRYLFMQRTLTGLAGVPAVGDRVGIAGHLWEVKRRLWDDTGDVILALVRPRDDDGDEMEQPDTDELVDKGWRYDQPMRSLQ